MIQMRKNEMFSHSRVFANLADENSVISLFCILNSIVLLHPF